MPAGKRAFRQVQLRKLNVYTSLQHVLQIGSESSETSAHGIITEVSIRERQVLYYSNLASKLECNGRNHG
jgi:hypothetical protein